MATYPVKWFAAPAMGGCVPTSHPHVDVEFVNILKQCLITGFNDQAPTTITYDNPTTSGTATFPGAHGFVEYQIILIEGADQAAFNGEHRVTSITETSITFEMDTVPAQNTATGSLNVKAAPATGWSLEEDDLAGNIVLKRTSPNATPTMLWVENDTNKVHPSRPSVSFGTSQCNVYTIETPEWRSLGDPLNETIYKYQWGVGNWTQVPSYPETDWYIFADGLMFYWVVYNSYYGRGAVYAFGDIQSIVPGDQSHCMIVANVGDYETNTGRYWTNSSDASYSSFLALARAEDKFLRGSHTQEAGTVLAATYGIMNDTGTSDYRRVGDNMDFPNPCDNGLYVSSAPMYVKDSSTSYRGLRGFIPGFLQPMQTSSIYHNKILTTVPGLEGIPIIFFHAAYHRQTNIGATMTAVRLDKWREDVG